MKMHKGNKSWRFKMGRWFDQRPWSDQEANAADCWTENKRFKGWGCMGKHAPWSTGSKGYTYNPNASLSFFHFPFILFLSSFLFLTVPFLLLFFIFFLFFYIKTKQTKKKTRYKVLDLTTFRNGFVWFGILDVLDFSLLRFRKMGCMAGFGLWWIGYDVWWLLVLGFGNMVVMRFEKLMLLFPGFFSCGGGIENWLLIILIAGFGWLKLDFFDWNYVMMIRWWCMTRVWEVLMICDYWFSFLFSGCGNYPPFKESEVDEIENRLMSFELELSELNGLNGAWWCGTRLVLRKERRKKLWLWAWSM